MTLASGTLRAALFASVALTQPLFAHEETRRTELFAPGVEHAEGGPATIGARPPLIEGLGQFGMDIETRSPEAQAYFDQGLGYLWGFNHTQAVRAFRTAQGIDPACAMCFWGEAYALGPNLNDVMHDAAVAPAWAAARKAAELARTLKEQALTQALLLRYAPEVGDRSGLDQAFADAMGAVATQWPDDANLQTIRADALMNLQPWDYWEAGGTTPKGNGGEILASLERALRLAPDHPAALHLYIHAVEASVDPARAEAAADRLRGAVPSAGHLVHMPAHIYNRVGRFADSIEVNKAAIAADEAFIAGAGEAASPLYRYGYYPHNVHFLLVAAQSAGIADTTIEAAEKLARITSDELSSELAWVQAIRTAPFTAHAQFSDLETVLALPDPGAAFPFLQGFRHYTRGTALALAGDAAGAEAEAAAIARLIGTADFAGLEVQYLPARDVLGIARNVVEARIAQAAGDWDTAVRHLEAAIAIEDGIGYMEPPYWTTPVRRILGAVQLQAGRPEAAVAAFEAALAKAPNDGWTLWGLTQAITAKLDAGPAGAADRAALETAETAFRRAWLGDTDRLSLERL